MGRPKIYENATERQAAYRLANKRVDLVISASLDASLNKICERLDMTKNSLVNSMIRFSLTNRVDVKTDGSGSEK